MSNFVGVFFCEFSLISNVSLIVELLMSSLGHFLLIRVSIYQNGCIHE